MQFRAMFSHGGRSIDGGGRNRLKSKTASLKFNRFSGALK
jgi:hypothetical protein